MFAGISSFPHDMPQWRHFICFISLSSLVPSEIQILGCPAISAHWWAHKHLRFCILSCIFSLIGLIFFVGFYIVIGSKNSSSLCVKLSICLFSSVRLHFQYFNKISSAYKQWFIIPMVSRNTSVSAHALSKSRMEIPISRVAGHPAHSILKLAPIK